MLKLHKKRIFEVCLKLYLNILKTKIYIDALFIEYVYGHACLVDYPIKLSI